jgi:hypothetical protein
MNCEYSLFLVELVRFRKARYSASIYRQRAREMEHTGEETMLSEADTRANLIDPALAAAGWGPENVIREYYFTDGRKMAGNQRGSRCYVDYFLQTENRHLDALKATLLNLTFYGKRITRLQEIVC